MVKYIYKEFKSVLNKLKYPDSWFWARYTLNTYSGCAHACIYCDARSERYYLEDFENEVIIKTNFDKKLDQRFRRARTLLPDIIAPGGVNDAYQPIEQKIEHSRKILQVIAKYKFPVNIATKSKLIVRDIDILKEIAKKTWSTVGFSISTMNEELANFLEPHSSNPSERLKALHTIKQKAPEIQVGIYFMPIIPFLEDDDASLEHVIKQSKKAGAEFILFAPGLTLRDAQAQFFIKKLKNSKYNDIVKPLLELYKGHTNPPSNYVRKLNPKLYNLCQEYKLAVRINRWIPNDYRKWNYKLSELLLNKEYVDAVITGKSNNNMKWAGLNLNNLDVSITDVYKRDELSKLKNFSKEIIEFVKPYLEKIKITHEKTTLERFIN
ncbi:MAG: radical SAM protein [Candidatus Hermodarchaeota archaeon]